MSVMRQSTWVLGLLLASGPGTAAQEPGREAVVTVTVENMYSGPDASRDVVSQATLGQVVKVLESRGGFASIETPDRYPGWIPEAALAFYPDSSSTRYASKGRVGRVTSLMANVYRDPSVTSARPKLLAPLGTNLELLPASPREGWHALRLPSGEVGFMQAGDLRVADAAEPPAKPVGTELTATARRFLGVPYLWGGMTAHGLDCSGFVSRVYAFHGMTLLRDADLQFEDPRAATVEKADLKAGDLLFFGSKNITHVGLYQGEGRFIHATTHDHPVVQESQLDDSHWTGLFRGARRPQ